MYDGEAIICLNLPLCSPRKTSLNLRNGLPNSPDADILNLKINLLNYNFTGKILITENYMNNDSSKPLLLHTHERSAATLRQTDGATRKPTQQKNLQVLI